MNIDDINPSENITMTALLTRLFKSEGCSPTICHACNEQIKIGDTFKLVTHPKTDSNGNDQSPRYGHIDEMCCSKCGSDELKSRDIKLQESWVNHRADKIRQGGHGFSRASKQLIKRVSE